MNAYNIYKNSFNQVKAVKIGWSWPAFLFSLMWAFINRMYGCGVLLLFVYSLLLLFIGLGTIGHSLTGGGVLPLDYIINSYISVGLTYSITGVIMGARGNSWREKNLKFRRYEFMETISASTSEEAMRAYRENAERKK